MALKNQKQAEGDRDDGDQAEVDEGLVSDSFGLLLDCVLSLF
ncbi:MAG: hypothetical protein ACFBSF_16275 [Leptolyngbyaceae cyanobacterium]